MGLAIGVAGVAAVTSTHVPGGPCGLPMAYYPWVQSVQCTHWWDKPEACSSAYHCPVSASCHRQSWVTCFSVTQRSLARTSGGCLGAGTASLEGAGCWCHATRAPGRKGKSAIPATDWIDGLVQTGGGRWEYLGARWKISFKVDPLTTTKKKCLRAPTYKAIVWVQICREKLVDVSKWTNCQFNRSRKTSVSKIHDDILQ